MNIGIIVHSYTGNTLSVAEKMKKVFEEKGHTVKIEKLKVIDENPNSMKNIKFGELPVIDNFDCLIFGGPVWAFSLSAPLKLYLNQLSDLGGRKAGCFVTHQFPFNWMGGNRSIKQMVNILNQKNAQVVQTGIVSWSKKMREQTTLQTIKDFGDMV